jgi:hypothetical protein
MATHPRLYLSIGIGLCATWLSFSGPEAWEIPTHQAITGEAAGSSQVGSVLQEALGVGDGLNFIASDGSVSLSIRDWLNRGSAREDDSYYINSQYNPFGRFWNHFHHPLRTWDTAGLTDIGTGQSSVLWAQTDPQNAYSTGNWSWQEVRRQFSLALTSAQKADRDAALARTFRGLGQQLHLVQDVASIPHARNEAHSTGDNIESWASRRFQRFRPLDFSQLLAQTPRILPKPELFSKPANPLAPIPISRFIDADEYTGENAEFTATLQDATDSFGTPVRLTPVGLAEFTNANFVSRDTILTGDTLTSTHKWWSPYPRRASTDLAILQQGGKLPETVLAEDGQLDSNLYMSKIADGERIPRFLKPTYAATFLNEQGLPLVYTLKFQLDDNIYEDYARRLLPRAVGYSGGLLDYFFRGKLDVDLVAPDDAGTYQLAATNRSDDRLVEGTLSLYADDPVTGTRTLVEGAAALPVANVSKDAALFPGPGSPAFQVPDSAERFLAVYQGTLGQEAKGAAGTFPGAVIGKVLGGVRVEEVFADETDLDSANWVWRLRTPTGVFRLPLSDSEYEEVAWGDPENTLVAHTPFGPDELNQVTAYEVMRQPNSVEPLLEDTPQGPTVQLRSLKEATLPFGLALGTTVQIQHTITYRQQLVTDERTNVFRWSNPADPHSGWYIWDHTDHAIHISTLVSRTLPFADSFALVLDRVHLETWTNETNQASYVWWVSEVAWTADGHLLAVVGASLTAPPYYRWPTESQPVYGLDTTGAEVPLEWCGAFACYPLSIGLRRTYPLGVDPLLWALVDLTDGRVIASTAEATLTITSAEAVEAPDWTGSSGSAPPVVYVHNLERRTGGSNPTPPGEDQDKGWTPASLAYPTGPLTFTDLTLDTGVDLSLTGWLRPELLGELTRVGLFGTTPGFQPSPTELAFGGDGQGLRVLRPARPEWHPAQLGASLRARPAPGGERVVFQTEVGAGAGIYGDSVLVWDPAASRAQHLARFPAGLESPSELWSATRDTALVRSPSLGQWVLLSLDADPAPRFVDDPTGQYDFTLLDPHSLYEITSGKFYRAQPPAQRTPLPRALAEFTGDEVWADYHAIRLP